MDASERLTAVFERISNLRAPTCSMLHERVRIDRSGAPTRRYVDRDRTMFVRVGLCPWAERALSLSCAHTTARFALSDALEALCDAGYISIGRHAELLDELDTISNGIHRLDWERSEAETALAIAVEGGNSEDLDRRQGVLQLQTCLDAMAEKHAAYAQRVAVLYKVVLSYVVDSTT